MRVPNISTLKVGIREACEKDGEQMRHEKEYIMYKYSNMHIY